ncbi:MULTISPECIES: cytochrome c oxidase assembly protein [unclassified Embleya]|uniref:cytochrome c oxidase assembly protein n=1 Tax=unclassified Embleya TaxID=2699296 RepID=UPI003405B511
MSGSAGDAGMFLAHATPGNVPPELTPIRLLTGWVFEPIPILVAMLFGGLYLYGVHKLRARGDSWSRWRSFSFLGLGLGTFLLATESALAAYDTVLLSVHMVQHMVLAMITPIFLALGAPITLALRTLPAKWRNRLNALLHSRYAKVVTFPAFAGFIFVLNPFALYFTPWYELTLRNTFMHDMNHVHFVIIGCMWFWPLLGLDPMPRASYPMRLLAVFATLPFHAWLGIAIMSSSNVLAGDWYNDLGRDWGASPLSDQGTAGGILWGSGDIIGLLVFLVLFVQWARASEREAVREDRRLDRLELIEAGRKAREERLAREAAEAGEGAEPGLEAAGKSVPKSTLPGDSARTGEADSAVRVARGSEPRSADAAQ